MRQAQLQLRDATLHASRPYLEQVASSFAMRPSSRQAMRGNPQEKRERVRRERATKIEWRRQLQRLLTRRGMFVPLAG